MDKDPLQDYEEFRRRQEEFDHVLEKYSAWLIDERGLKELSGMLSFVNYVFFSVMGWIAFAWLAPIVNHDDRPAWLMWLILGPLFGFFFCGLGGLIAWYLVAHWLGGFLFTRQGDPVAAVWWHRFLGEGESEWKARQRRLPP